MIWGNLRLSQHPLYVLTPSSRRLDVANFKVVVVVVGLTGGSRPVMVSNQLPPTYAVHPAVSPKFLGYFSGGPANYIDSRLEHQHSIN